MQEESKAKPDTSHLELEAELDMVEDVVGWLLAEDGVAAVFEKVVAASYVVGNRERGW